MTITEEQKQISYDPRLEELFRAGVQFGYARTRRHPRMREYIAGVKSNIEILSLDRVFESLETALTYLEELGKIGAAVMWVGTKPAASLVVKRIAEELGHPYVDGRWLGGTITNFDVIRKRVTHWQDLVAKKNSGELEKYTKQERLMIQRETERLESMFAGLLTYTALPKAMFVVDTKEEAIAIAEAGHKQIPVIGLMNTDCDPHSAAYPIPGNDNAPESISLILEKAKAAYLRGKQSVPDGN
ncbi:MAG: 30S ribosomal protein S2 [Patescibacteria group bacterium]